MNKSVICFWARHLAVGWMGVMSWVNVGQAALPDQPGSAPRITVHVYNWAEVEPATLREAKEVATRVFRNSGLEAEVVDARSFPDEEQAAAAEEVSATDFFVHIFSPARAKQFRLPATMLGVAPGTAKEKDRTTVYVFDQVAGEMVREHQEQVLAHAKGAGSRPIDKGQILGHAIAHEIGHVLLHQDSHARAGLMRASWNRQDFQDMIAGQLGFSREEAERVKIEVVRRGSVRKKRL